MRRTTKVKLELLGKTVRPAKRPWARGLGSWGGLFYADCELITAPCCSVCVSTCGSLCSEWYRNTRRLTKGTWEHRRTHPIRRTREKTETLVRANRAPTLDPTQRGYKVNLSVNRPVSLYPRHDASPDETLCAKRVRDTKSQGSGVVTGVVQRVNHSRGFRDPV